jgi:hypothetical protein
MSQAFESRKTFAEKLFPSNSITLLGKYWNAHARNEFASRHPLLYKLNNKKKVWLITHSSNYIKECPSEVGG